MENLNIKICKVTLRDFKNVEYGVLDFACSKKKNMEAVDIMGIYGQNGSGKTALIESLGILKIILSGRSVPEEYVNYIASGKSFSRLEFSFRVTNSRDSYKIDYGFDIVKKNVDNESNVDILDESVKYRVGIENEIISMSGIIMGKKIKMQELINTGSKTHPFAPIYKYNEIIGNDKELKTKLTIIKQVAYERSQSFVFYRDTLSIIKNSCKIKEYNYIFSTLVNYGNFYLYVLDTVSTGLINLNAALPFFFRLGNEKSLSTGSIAIKLDGSSVVPIEVCDIIQKTILNMNMVLVQLIPGLNVRLEKLGTTLLPDKSEGCIVELFSIRDSKIIPLKYESEGIKKIVSMLQLLIAMYNNESITVAIDELDAGIFEYLLGELLKIIAESGKGQLIFTSHNLRPLETLDKKYIYFTTTNKENRYVQLESVQTNNNLRNFYYRDITLGSQKEELYNLTNNYEIALSLNSAGDLGEE